MAAALAGCGGHDRAPAAAETGTGAGGAAPRQGSRPGEPRGHLTVAEYRAIVTEYRKLRPLQKGNEDAAAIQRGRQVCAQLKTPRTVLVGRVRADCDNAISFFAALSDLEKAGTECTSGSERDRIVCGRDRYSTMADAIQITTDGGRAINSELERRGIRGLCAESIGMTPSQVGAYRRAEQAARDAVDSISVADATGFERAQGELADALDSGASGDPLAGIIRGCRPPSAKPAKPRATPPAPAPKPRKKRLPRVPSDGGINA
jgi:hypothetical protein